MGLLVCVRAMVDPLQNAKGSGWKAKFICQLAEP